MYDNQVMIRKIDRFVAFIRARRFVDERKGN
jgi:hypothetical protein